MKNVVFDKMECVRDGLLYTILAHLPTVHLGQMKCMSEGADLPSVNLRLPAASSSFSWLLGSPSYFAL